MDRNLTHKKEREGLLYENGTGFGGQTKVMNIFLRS